MHIERIEIHRKREITLYFVQNVVASIGNFKIISWDIHCRIRNLLQFGTQTNQAPDLHGLSMVVSISFFFFYNVNVSMLCVCIHYTARLCWCKFGIVEWPFSFCHQMKRANFNNTTCSNLRRLWIYKSQRTVASPKHLTCDQIMEVPVISAVIKVGVPYFWCRTQ